MNNCQVPCKYEDLKLSQQDLSLSNTSSWLVQVRNGKGNKGGNLTPISVHAVHIEVTSFTSNTVCVTVLSLVADYWLVLNCPACTVLVDLGLPVAGK